MTIIVRHGERAQAPARVPAPRRDGWPRQVLVPLLRALFPLNVEGGRNLLGLPTPCILAAEHGSHLDTLAILAALPEGIRAGVRVAAAEDYWYRDPLRRAAAGALGGFPFPRKGGVGLARSAALLDGGHSILIYPQGTRTGGPFRPGVAILAAESGVPVVPIAVRGGRDLWPKGRALPRRGALTVAFGAPLRLAPGTAPLDGARQIEAAVGALAADPLAAARANAA